MKNTGETSGKDTQGAAKASGFVKPDKDAKKAKQIAAPALPAASRYQHTPSAC